MIAQLHEVIAKSNALLVRLDEAENAVREASWQAGEAGSAMADCLEGLHGSPRGESMDDGGAINALAAKQARAKEAEQSALAIFDAIEDEVLALEHELHSLVIET